jgi:hypothetical protein
MFFLPSDVNRTSDNREKDYLQIVARVLQQVRIPVALKISSSFSTLAQMIDRLSRTGIAALVLFNRFYSIDFDIEKMEVTGSGSLSSPAEIAGPLRWVALMSRRVGCDLLTLGQYLQPTLRHLPVVEYVTPEKFAEYGARARGMGFLHVASAPMVRSSYHADEVALPLASA